MIRKILLLMNICLISTLAMGQSDSKTINSIKRDNAYLYEEVTAKDANEAYQSAYELLKQRVKEYAEEEKSLRSANNIIIKDIKSYTQQIQMQRGDMTRVFLYVKKKDILSVESNATIIPNDKNRVESPQEEEQEIVLESKIEVIKPTGDESLKLQVAWQQEMINELLSCKTMAQAEVLLSRLKAEYKVKRYGSYATCSNKSACFWITSDGQGNVVSIWGPGNGERTNFRTLTKETVNVDSRAIWFTMTKQ